LLGFTSSDNYRDAYSKAQMDSKLGRMIYLQLSADGWNHKTFGKKGMAGIYATVLNLPADLRVKEAFVVCFIGTNTCMLFDSFVTDDIVAVRQSV
jgi:hypothetical protein